MALCCGVSSATSLPTVITRVPETPYRIRDPSTYLFAFPLSERSDGPVNVAVYLPEGRFRAGTNLIVSNLSAPVSEISLVLYYVSASAPQPPGFPVSLTSYQQQTFWWIPGSGWMYAGGFTSSPAFAQNTGGSFTSVTFDPQAVASYIQITTNPATLEPLCNAYVTNITGTSGITGAIDFNVTGGICPGPFTSIGPGSGLTYPPGKLSNGYSNCMCTTGQLNIAQCDTYHIIGTVTITLLVGTGWNTVATSTDVPPSTNSQTLTFSGCTLTSSNVTGGYCSLTVYLSPYPDGSLFVPFYDNTLPVPIVYSWYFANYNSALPASSSFNSMIIKNQTASTGTILTIESTVNGTTYTATMNYSGSNPGDTSYAYTLGSATLSVYPSGSTPVPGGYKPHLILPSLSPPSSVVTTPVGTSYWSAVYGSTPLFTGYFTLSNLIPLPTSPGGSIVFVLDDATRLTATVTEWSMDNPATNTADIYITITGIAPP